MDLPELAPPEQALLQRFAADESPSPGAVRRIEARLAARLRSGDADIDAEPLAPVYPFAHFGKAAVIACALAAAVLLVLGGSARLVHAVRDNATATQASDVNTTAPHSGRAQEISGTQVEPARAPVVAPESPLVVPLPPSTPIDLAAVPGALDPPRRDATPKPSPRPGPVVAPGPAPADAAAEIALLNAAQRERDPERRLAKVREYGETFPKGALSIEIAVLEIESLCALGRTDKAADKSAAFLRKHPDSAYAAIARRGCSREGGRR